MGGGAEKPGLPADTGASQNFKKRPKRKKILLVNRDFQLRYTRAAIGVGILSTVLTAAVILYPLYVFEIIRIANFVPIPIMVAMGMAAAFNIAFLGMMAIFITHKMAGPMYSLVRHFRLVGMGEWRSRMRLREEDEMKFVVRNFNGMLDELELLVNDDVKLIDETITELSGEKPAEEALAASIKSLEQLKSRLKDRVQKEPSS